MKKTGLLTLLMLVMGACFAQGTLDKAIDKLKTQRGLEKIEIAGFLTQFAGIMPFTGLPQEAKSFLRRTSHLLVLASEGDNKVDFYKDLKTEIESNQYEKLLSIKNNDEDVLIMAKPGEEGISDLLVITSGAADHTLIHLAGKYDAKFIGQLLNN